MRREMEGQGEGEREGEGAFDQSPDGRLFMIEVECNSQVR